MIMQRDERAGTKGIPTADECKLNTAASQVQRGTFTNCIYKCRVRLLVYSKSVYI